jgi:4-hydroxythreonine-4-phosphate dehydrogenase
MTTNERPIIAVTMGDAAGVGPEVIARAIAFGNVDSICRPLVVGDSGIMREAIALTGSPLALRAVNKVSEAGGGHAAIDILDLHNIDRGEFTRGKICPSCGAAAMEYISRAVGLALSGEVRALVTAPINKEATRRAGYGELGHLEYIARLTGASEYATMLVSGPLRVVHLTTHYSLREACNFVTRERILARLKLTQCSFRDWGTEHPRIAVAAINPHAGEGGLLGSEEIEEIAPAVQDARDLGIDARGPFPADSVFFRAINGEFDVVLAMYHDQGHIPVKVYGFEKSVSIAMGLPLVRTSVDHGTAFDIAGKGTASHKSLVEAIKTAVRLVNHDRIV